MKDLRYLLHLFIILFIPGITEAQTELVGNWTGTLYQKPWDGSSGMMKYKFSMKLELVNGKLQGKSTIITGPNFGVILLKGEFHDNLFKFEEYKIEDQKVSGMSWCLKSGALKLIKEGKDLKLSGDWTGYVKDGNSKRDCNPGNLVLKKEQGYISLKGFTVNEKTSHAVSSNILIIDKSTNKKVAEVYCSSGEFDINLPGSSEYELTVTSKGFLTRYESVKLTSSQVLNIPLTPIQVGQNVPLKNILFVKSTSQLTKDSSPELERLLQFLKNNPYVSIEIQGHTSNEGDAEKNRILSEERAKVIRDYLVKNGIAAERITAKGYGGSKPVAPNDSEEHRVLNRRVEFVIMKK